MTNWTVFHLNSMHHVHLFTEMEFLNSILVEVSRHKLGSSQAQVFVWFSTLCFPVYKMLFMNRLDFPVCRIFCMYF